MGKFAAVSIRHRRALNQAMLHARRAPTEAMTEPAILVRALRTALRMTQAQLARRAEVPRAHLARIESGPIDPQVGTVRRLFDSMFCDLVVLPWPRKRPSDALAERELEKPPGRKVWDDSEVIR